jgi:hypothetical protein
VADAQPSRQLADRRTVITELCECSQSTRENLRLGGNIGGRSGTTNPAGGRLRNWFGPRTMHGFDGSELDKAIT